MKDTIPIFKQTIQGGSGGEFLLKSPPGENRPVGFRVMEVIDGTEVHYILRIARCLRCYREFTGQWRPFRFWFPFCSGCPV